MKQLQVFKNSKFGELGVLEIDGKAYFPATACAKALGYTKPHNAIYQHCRYSLKQGVPHPQNESKTVEMKFIPEGDLYRLITHSKLPTAEKFEHWVFDEVLPSIRKHGSYQTENSRLQNAELIGTIVTEVFKQVLPSIGGMVSMLVKEEMNANAQPAVQVDALPTELPSVNVLQKFKRRSTGKVARLVPSLRTEVERMLKDGKTYKEIVGFLSNHGETLSQMAVCTYAKKLNDEEKEKLQIQAANSVVTNIYVK